MREDGESKKQPQANWPLPQLIGVYPQLIINRDKAVLISGFYLDRVTVPDRLCSSLASPISHNVVVDSTKLTYLKWM